MAETTTSPHGARRPLSAETLRRLTPLIECTTERSGWRLCVEIARDLLDADLVVGVELLGDDRGKVQSGIGFEELRIGTVIPIPPGSQARFALERGMCVTGHLPTEKRFTPSPILLREGAISSMTMAIDLLGGEQAIIGAHSRRPQRFDAIEVESFEALGRVFGSAIRRVRKWDELELNARIDPLTGLMNRASILQYLEECFSGDTRLSALLIDIDGFKNVNDTLGHRYGDTVLRTLADRIEASIGPKDRLGRLGGDEFLLVAEDTDSLHLAERLIGHVEAVIMVESSVVQLSASVGIARRRMNDDAMGMIERADRLMYEAKSAGRGEVRCDVIVDDRPIEFTDERTPRCDGITEFDVDEAIRGLRLVVQPIVDPVTTRVHGVEALARGPVGHSLELPDALFAAATTFSRLGDLELASKRLAFQLPLDDGVRLYINLEPVLLSSESWMTQLAEAWASSPTRPSVTVELPERGVLASPGRLLRAVEACRRLGWRIALDDVGSRSESLAALRWIDPDVVKLDIGLISRDTATRSAHVVAAIAAYRSRARRGDVQVIAEGVETLEDVRLADVLGADLLQGHLFGKPGSVEDLRLAEQQRPRSMVPSPARSEGRRIATKRDLLVMTRHVEETVQSSGHIVLASMQNITHLSKQTRRQYQSLARRCGFVGIVGVKISNIDEALLRGVRLADIAPSDPMAANWQVVSISPTASIALLATEVDPSEPGSTTRGVSAGADMDRLFRYEIMTDPGAVEDAARSLLRYF